MAHNGHIEHKHSDWPRRRVLQAGLAGAALVPLLPLLSTAWADDEVGWKHMFTEQGVAVWNRLEPGREVPVFKGIGMVDASLFEVLAVLDDVSRHTDWMANCTQAKILKQVGEFDRIMYNRTHAPWPVSDRDAVLNCTVDGSMSRREVLSPFASIASSLQPPIDGIVRMPRLRGFYKLTATDDKHTRVTYQIDVDPGGHLPDFVVESTSRKLPLDTVTSLRRQVAKTRGRYEAFLAKYDPSHGGTIPLQFQK